MHILSTEIYTGIYTGYPQVIAKKELHLKYFLLDTVINGCKIASLSRLLTGNLTSTGRWSSRGDTLFADRRSGKPLSRYARS
jgi:hypothetical protein